LNKLTHAAASHQAAISVATFGSVFIMKCVAPIRALDGAEWVFNCFAALTHRVRVSALPVLSLRERFDKAAPGMRMRKPPSAEHSRLNMLREKQAGGAFQLLNSC
jgi:hypothetical protein